MNTIYAFTSTERPPVDQVGGKALALIAMTQAGPQAKGAVMASDAFFPFPDNVVNAAKHGIAAIVQPGGSNKDQDSIDECDKNDIAMVFTGKRHFLH